MLFPVDEIKDLPEFAGKSEKELESSLKAIEAMIRKYTNNNFQVRAIRFCGSSSGNLVYGYNQYLRTGDTVEISGSINAGLYVIKSIADDSIQLDGELYEVDCNLVTKIFYPDDIKMGVVNLMKWEYTNRDKVGVKSETLSRHSVTYYDQDVNNTVMGYPVSLMAFLKPYMKARF